MRTIASGTPAHTQESPRFTPGPWHARSDRCIVSGGRVIGETYEFPDDLEEADANERLIIAAPALYAALAEIVEDDDNQTLPGFKTIERARQALRLVREGAVRVQGKSDERPLHVLDFPSKAVRVYAISPGADLFDVRTLLEARISQLESLLTVPYGECGPSFRGLNDDLQDSFMWTCSYLASEVRALHDVVGEMQREGGAK